MSIAGRVALCVVIAASATTRGPAADDAELKKIITQAQKAGNADGLTKRTAWTVVTKTVSLDGEKRSHVHTSHVQLPDRVWSEIVTTDGDQKTTVLVVVNGAKGWRKEGDAVTEMPAAWAEGVLRNFRAEGIRLVCALNDPDHEPSLEKDGKAGDRATHVVKVHSKGGGYDKHLHFDQKTGALLMQTDPKTGLEVAFSDVKAVDGVPVAQTRTTKVNGKAGVEQKLEVKFVEKFDAKRFEKP